MKEKYKSWLKKFGIAGFLFFLIKGILWLIFGAAIYQWLRTLFVCFGFVLMHSTIYAQIAKQELSKYDFLKITPRSLNSYFYFESNKQKAFTCKLEEKFNAKRKLQYKFRLGTLEYTNSMEYPKSYPGYLRGLSQ